MLSNEERERIMAKAQADNERDGWGFNEESFFRLVMRHKYGDEATRLYVEERLEDANFHTPCRLVKFGHWDAALLDFYDHHLVGGWDSSSNATLLVGEYFREAVV